MVWFEPGETHRHGASPEAAVQHVAIQEALVGNAAGGMEHVGDERYQRAPGAR